MAYEDLSESLLCDNILTVIKANLKTKLDTLYPTAPLLPDLAERTLGSFIRMSFPALTVQPHRGSSLDEGDYLENEFKIDMYLAVSDPDAPTVQRKLLKYSRALRQILREMTVAQVNAGTSKVIAHTLNMSWEYGDPEKNPNDTNVYMCPASFELTLKFNER